MMDSTTAQLHHQEMDNQTLESMLVCTKTTSNQEKKPRPAAEQALKCPRCDSTNTKFCYYNNYSLSQPRYFCKSCRRYWTKGGTLRNVPVGGGCRRSNNKRSSSSSSSSSKAASKSVSQDHHQFIIPPHHHHHHPNNIPSFDCNDLNLAFARLEQQQKQVTNNSTSQLGLFDDNLSLMLPQGNNNNGFQGGFYNYNGSQLGMQQEQFEGDYNNYSTSSTVKQEMSNSSSVGVAAPNPHVLFGFPWHNTSSTNNSGDGLSWISNGINGSSNSNWHGLLNSPLM